MMLLWTPQSIFFRRFKMGGSAGCDYVCFFWESAIADKLHGFGKNNICGEIPIVLECILADARYAFWNFNGCEVAAGKAIGGNLGNAGRQLDAV